VTIGGINLGVSAFSPHPDDAFEAIRCLANKQNQATDAVKGGLPPTLAALYDDPAVQKAYPFHALIKHSLRAPALRPQTPAYSDVSLAIQKGLSPPNAIDPKSIVSTLKSPIKNASSGALL